MGNEESTPYEQDYENACIDSEEDFKPIDNRHLKNQKDELNVSAFQLTSINFIN